MKTRSIFDKERLQWQTKNKEKKTPEIDVERHGRQPCAEALKALEQFMDMTQEQVDKIVEAMTVAGQENHTRLAKMAVEETGRGVYEEQNHQNMLRHGIYLALHQE